MKHWNELQYKNELQFEKDYIESVIRKENREEVEEILNLTPEKIVTSLANSKEHFEMFILVIIAFMLLVLLTIFKVFDLKDYKSDNYKVTNNIEIPMPVGNSQTQQGSAWWLPKKELSKQFGVNRLDPNNSEVKKLIKVAKELSKKGVINSTGTFGLIPANERKVMKDYCKNLVSCDKIITSNSHKLLKRIVALSLTENTDKNEMDEMIAKIKQIVKEKN